MALRDGWYINFVLTQIWIAGDLNLPNINWNNNSVEGFSYPIPLCNILLEFLHTYGFTQTVDFATRAKNTLDILVPTDHLL